MSKLLKIGWVRCLAVLLVTAIHGTIYVALMPPWSHYDEPTHFEYAWLIANRLRLPQQDDIDPIIRREVAASMLEHGFYRDLEYEPDLLTSAPIQIGASELSHPPLYYILVALPLRFLRYSDVRTQLYAGRAVSGLLYLASIAIACGLMAELVGQDHPLSWLVPATMALLPSYADLMTALNNDAGAVAALSLFLWGAARTIRRGPTIRNVVWLSLSTLLCVYTKNTAAIAVVLLPVTLVLGWIVSKRQWKRLPLAVAALGGLLLLLLSTITWGNAALWFQKTSARPTSQIVAEAPVGKRALALGAGNQAHQFLTATEKQAIQGQVVTLGAWIWSSLPTTVRGLSLSDGYATYTAPKIEVDSSPAFYTLTTTVSAEATYVLVRLNPGLDPDSTQDTPAQVVYYDGLVLAEGERPPHPTPHFDGPQARAGDWAGQPFVNRLRNGSAERTGPYVRPIVERLIVKYTRRSPSDFVTSVLDWERTKGIYPSVVTSLLQSFWARFGWNHISLPQGWYWGLAAATAIGLAGSLVAYLRLQDTRQKAALELLAAATLLVWANAVLRVHPASIRILIPAARYAYPAIVPTALALAGGWWSLPPRRIRPWTTALVLCGLLVLDGFSIWTIAQYYSGV